LWPRIKLRVFVEVWQCPKSTWRKSPETKQQEQYILDWEERFESKRK
jgi:hypothetical protein